MSGINEVQVKDEYGDAEKPNCCRKLTQAISGGLENMFAWFGFKVASNPWKTILISIICFGLCMVGNLEYESENRGEKQWVSQSSDSIKHKDWVDGRFSTASRVSSVSLKSDDGDILNKDGLVELYHLNSRILNISNGVSYVQWSDICYKTGGLCVPTSILELWSYNLTKVKPLSRQQILDVINQKVLISPITRRPLNILTLLGGPVERAADGSITKASTAKIVYKIIKNATFDKALGNLVDENAEEWEEKFTEETGKSIEGYTIFSYNRWAHVQAASGASDDLVFFVFGYILVILYLTFMLGNFSRLDNKLFLAVLGIAVIGMSVGIAYGLGSAFQLKISQVHNVLPFLLLGIGVDDIFVIVQSWYNIGGGVSDGRTIPEKASQALKHSGVSILVTSVTDFCAFGIGASTILPALRSFSIFAAIGILAVFMLTISFFLAWLCIDAKRQESRRDAILCCLKLGEKWKPMECSEKAYLSTFMEKIYAPAVLSLPGKIIGLLLVAGLLAGGAVGLASLEQDFDEIWFLPPTSTPRVFVENDRVFFPIDGERSALYTGPMNYYEERAAMDTMVKHLNENEYVANNTVISWYHSYNAWLENNHKGEMIQVNTGVWIVANEKKYMELLDTFLNSDHGKFFRPSVNITNGKIQAAVISFKHTGFTGSAEQIKGMDGVIDDIKEVRGAIKSGEDDLPPFVYSFKYIGWETNKVISKELFRNVLLATLCVLLVTLFLLSDILASFLVVLSIAFSLVNIAGYMHFWGLSIDVVTTIIMVIAIGLTVDYSAHIAHGFMVANQGGRNERMKHTLTNIAPAVVHGGTSTMLAFILLAGSDSYGFKTFFKVFFLTVIFGMLHGMVFIPIAFSLVGPKPYTSPTSKPVSQAQVANGCYSPDNEAAREPTIYDSDAVSPRIADKNADNRRNNADKNNGSRNNDGTWNVHLEKDNSSAPATNNAFEVE